MLTINLLPWRDERRQKKNHRFLAGIIGILVLGSSMLLWIYCPYLERHRFQAAVELALKQRLIRAENEELKLTKIENASQKSVVAEVTQSLTRIKHLLYVLQALTDHACGGVYLHQVILHMTHIEIKGRAQNAVKIQVFIANLMKRERRIQLKSMGYKKEGYQFAIRIPH